MDAVLIMLFVVNAVLIIVALMLVASAIRGSPKRSRQAGNRDSDLIENHSASVKPHLDPRKISAPRA